MKDHIIPKATARRLPLYYCYLRTLNNVGKKKVSSTELNEATQVDSATIRRDFSYPGELGKRGYGYDIEDPMHFFAETLDDDRLINIMLTDVGNLGSALLKYRFHQSNSIRVSCAFDANEEIVGCIVDGIPVHSMEDTSGQTKI